MNAMRTSDDGRAVVLADGRPMPTLGLGVWQTPDGKECVDAVRFALDAGYRHIDTAQAYGNEESVGKALAQSGLEREAVFITTKFYPRQRDPFAAVEESLRRLGTDYVNLYLVHWPEGGPTWAWEGMERSAERGYARSIGVSNFDTAELDAVCSMASIAPVANQIQVSPFEYRRALLDACDGHQMAVEAYSPLGTGRHLGDPTVAEVAARVGRTPAQVLLRWCLQHGLIVLPKSVHRERIEENGAVFDFTLAAAGMATLDALDTTGHTGAAREQKWWK